ncbi:MAG: hypothetical protein AAFO74_06505 [Pseudomonadota bacterium]
MNYKHIGSPAQASANKSEYEVSTAYFTICANNYYAYAKTLQNSLALHEPGSKFFIFIADAYHAEIAKDASVIYAENICASNIDEAKFAYSLIEFSTYLKPFCFYHLLENCNFKNAVFLDPDVEVFAPLEGVTAAFSNDASCVLTPHLLKPLEDDAHPSDTSILNTGTFNLGFAAFSQTDETWAFLKWWARHLETNCRVDLEAGLFVDQKFVEFAPSFIKNLHILRHPGYNVAYWNLANRSVHKTGTEWSVNGEKLVFFHFSGVMPENKSMLSKHQDRFSPGEFGDAQTLVENYLKKVEKNDHSRWSSIPYAYDFFETGAPVPKEMRRGPPLKKETPLSAPNSAYWNAPSEYVDQAPSQVITRYMLAVHESRADLKRTFPLSSAVGRSGFSAWFQINYVSHSYDEQSASKLGVRLQRITRKWLIHLWLAVGRRLKLI